MENNQQNKDAQNSFDVIVVGAGHAGIEACLATSRRGLKTLIVTSNVSRIGFMSCNPAMGGLAKGHMIREIDALGGEMALATDATCIQFKRLNSRKGPAVRGSRAQCDKDLYVEYMTQKLKSQNNLKVLEGEVKSLILKNNICNGVVLHDGSEILSKTVIITTGTFMNGVMHLGLEQSAGGRVGDKATVGLSDQLRSVGFVVRRLKTGTPPRLLKESIDFSKTQEEKGDDKFYAFSFRSDKKLKLPQISCYLSYTNEKTHEIIQNNLHKSPMYCGVIEGVGPRYCPSIEDKVTRFADKPRHQTFLEPEGLSTNHIYLQGISTSLPPEVQDQFVRTIPGLENVKFARYGYAIEYDFIEPTQIQASLETRAIENLFLAGQINGTSGYEEAGAQGLIAGINAGQKILNKEPLVLGRDQAYTGVLIDDLVTKGTQEPYRMFTSRAEHRLVLREDNTLDRLLRVGHDLGLINDSSFEVAMKLEEQRKTLSETLRSNFLYPNEKTNQKLTDLGTAALLKPASLETILRRSEINFTDLKNFEFDFLDADIAPDIYEPLEIEIKYSGYVKRQTELIEQAKRLERLNIAPETNYQNIKGLSQEEVEKLSRVRPTSIGQAQRISGVNPSAIQALLVYMKKQQNIKGQKISDLRV